MGEFTGSILGDGEMVDRPCEKGRELPRVQEKRNIRQTREGELDWSHLA